MPQDVRKDDWSIVTTVMTRPKKPHCLSSWLKSRCCCARSFAGLAADATTHRGQSTNAFGKTVAVISRFFEMARGTLRHAFPFLRDHCQEWSRG